jgi:hypothetical protein
VEFYVFGGGGGTGGKLLTYIWEVNIEMYI